jgi:hypothetical protein
MSAMTADAVAAPPASIDPFADAIAFAVTLDAMIFFIAAFADNASS